MQSGVWILLREGFRLDLKNLERSDGNSESLINALKSIEMKLTDELEYNLNLINWFQRFVCSSEQTKPREQPQTLTDKQPTMEHYWSGMCRHFFKG